MAHDDLIEALATGPDNKELTPREFALLGAYLRHRTVSLAGLWNPTPADIEAHDCRIKLKRLYSFNQELQRCGGLEPEPEVETPKPKATINARMIDLIHDPETHAWSSQKFAVKLGCSKSSIVATAAWKELATAREMARQDRATTTQRRREGGRSTER